MPVTPSERERVATDRLDAGDADVAGDRLPLQSSDSRMFVHAGCAGTGEAKIDVGKIDDCSVAPLQVHGGAGKIRFYFDQAGSRQGAHGEFVCLIGSSLQRRF